MPQFKTVLNNHHQIRHNIICFFDLCKFEEKLSIPLPDNIKEVKVVYSSLDHLTFPQGNDNLAIFRFEALQNWLRKNR